MLFVAPLRIRVTRIKRKTECSLREAIEKSCRASSTLWPLYACRAAVSTKALEYRTNYRRSQASSLFNSPHNVTRRVLIRGTHSGQKQGSACYLGGAFRETPVNNTQRRQRRPVRDRSRPGLVAAFFFRTSGRRRIVLCDRLSYPFVVESIRTSRVLIN